MSKLSWTPGVTLDAIEQQVIEMAFRHFGFNKTITASSLGISIRTLDNKLMKYKNSAEEEKKRYDLERRKREHFLARSRGLVPADQQFSDDDGEAENSEAARGMGMEPIAVATSKPSLSMSEQSPIQGMLPSDITDFRTKKTR